MGRAVLGGASLIALYCVAVAVDICLATSIALDGKTDDPSAL